MSTQSGDHYQEVEITLLICSLAASDIARQISELTSVGQYQVRFCEHRAISDTYLDTPERQLHRANVSLRLRMTDGSPWVTFKGEPRRMSWGAVARLEIEKPWGEDALNAVLAQLEESGVKLPMDRSQYRDTDPLEVMSDLGLTPIQSRSNDRTVRELCRSISPEEVLAEMVIDSVTYRFGESEVRHLEVEIESRIPNDSTALQEASRWLVERYAPHLSIWPYGKLTTGAAVQQLLAQGDLQRFMDPNHHLLPPAYTAIKAYLEATTR
ncbi:MAG: CYTH domain-containing protein [Dehalococcoidia bacterium]